MSFILYSATDTLMALLDWCILCYVWCSCVRVPNYRTLVLCGTRVIVVVPSCSIPEHKGGSWWRREIHVNLNLPEDTFSLHDMHHRRDSWYEVCEGEALWAGGRPRPPFPLRWHTAVSLSLPPLWLHSRCKVELCKYMDALNNTWCHPNFQHEWMSMTEKIFYDISTQRLIVTTSVPHNAVEFQWWKHFHVLNWFSAINTQL